MSEQEDRTFFDTFMLILAFLVVFTVVIFAIANTVANRTIADRHHETDDAKSLLAERIKPEGRLCLEGAEDECEVEVAQVASAPASESDTGADAGEVSGEQVYTQNCAACHGQGIAGAPRVGDQDAWAARLEQGFETLLDHSINGYQGDDGFMPARGGNPNLSDEQVRASLDYMLDQLD